MRLVSQCTTQNLKLSVKWFSVSVMHGTINTSANRQRAVNGISPSGKAQDFDSCIRWFKSNYPSCRVLVAEFSAKIRCVSLGNCRT